MKKMDSTCAKTFSLRDRLQFLLLGNLAPLSKIANFTFADFRPTFANSSAIENQFRATIRKRFRNNCEFMNYPKR